MSWTPRRLKGDIVVDRLSNRIGISSSLFCGSEFDYDRGSCYVNVRFLDDPSGIIFMHSDELRDPTDIERSMVTLANQTKD